MKGRTFVGGVHPDYQKGRTAGLATRPLAPPEEIAVPLSQHIGAPAKACVAKGDEVLVGQPVGEAGGFVSAPVHASVSGEVKGIEPRPGAMGRPVESVIVENDGEDRPFEREGAGPGYGARASPEGPPPGAGRGRRGPPRRASPRRRGARGRGPARERPPRERI